MAAEPGTELRRTAEGVGGDAERGEGEGVESVLYSWTAFGGEEFESGGLDEGEVGGVGGGVQDN